MIVLDTLAKIKNGSVLIVKDSQRDTCPIKTEWARPIWT